jgi:hypothetical protein
MLSRRVDATANTHDPTEIAPNCTASWLTGAAPVAEVIDLTATSGAGDASHGFYCGSSRLRAYWTTEIIQSASPLRFHQRARENATYECETQGDSSSQMAFAKDQFAHADYVHASVDGQVSLPGEEVRPRTMPTLRHRVTDK